MRKKRALKSDIEKIYFNKQLHLSMELKNELLKTIKDIEKGDRISYLAYKLYPYVLKETYSNKSNELILLKKLRESKMEILSW